MAKIKKIRGHRIVEESSQANERGLYTYGKRVSSLRLRVERSN